ncbi:MAG: DNA polymerase III subunit delta [Ignavibacteriae bacterium]|nr:DNA polymerase III subunit delta [Ignavibacteriota bacterium]
MAKSNQGKEYLIKYSDLLAKAKSGKLQQNIFLFLNEKSLLEELLSETGQKFVGKSYDAKQHIRKFFSGDKQIEDVINECSNLGFFSEKKIVLYRVEKRTGVKGLSKDDKQALINYFRNSNPDTLLILHVQDTEYTLSNFDDFRGENITFYIKEETNSAEIEKWIKEKLEGYEVSEEAITLLLRYVNPSFDEVITELEKLKTYCAVSKKINVEDVNLCVGLTRDFNENDFIMAVMSRDMNKALKIYDLLSLKEEIEIRLVSYLISAFISVYKMFDPKIVGFDQWGKRKELKIWGKNADKMMEIYENYKNATNELKIMKAFDYIYRADKAFKTSSPDKRAIFTALISNLASL